MLGGVDADPRQVPLEPVDAALVVVLRVARLLPVLFTDPLNLLPLAPDHFLLKLQVCLNDLRLLGLHRVPSCPALRQGSLVRCLLVGHRIQALRPMLPYTILGVLLGLLLKLSRGPYLRGVFVDERLRIDLVANTRITAAQLAELLIEEALFVIPTRDLSLHGHRGALAASESTLPTLEETLPQLVQQSQGGAPVLLDHVLNHLGFEPHA
mmetsp:Transcript_100993/g.253208  ORF Transcript_100993/g.253208 Transcript_100993/m.253208 type:complete len:210 (-) Transcript_100993:307-936(-)